jgi:outer membrane usher protein
MTRVLPPTWWARVVLACGLALAPSAATAANDPLFDQVFGKRAERERRLAAEVVFDGGVGAAVDIVVSGNRLVAIDATGLADRLETLLLPEPHGCLRALGARAGKDALSGCGIEIGYDAATLQLRVDVPPALRRQIELAVQERPGFDAVLDGGGTLSAFVNLDASARRTAIGSASDSTGVLGLDGAIRWHGITAEFDAACRGGCTLGGRSVVVDRVDTRTRWRGGDLPDARAGSIGLPALRGIGWGTNFDLAPQDTYTPDLEAPLELTRASTVEVLLGDRVVQRYDLGPGRYNLTDFPLGFGENAAVLRITDDRGQVDTRRLDAYVDLALLDAGLSRHGVAIGRPTVPLLDDAGRPSQPWTVAVDWARGLGPRTTVAVAAASIPEFDRHALETRITHALRGWLASAALGCGAGLAHGCRGDLQFRRGNAGDPTRPRWQLEGAIGWRDGDWRDLFGNGGASARSLLLRASRPLSETWLLSLGAAASQVDGGVSRQAYSVQLGGRPLAQLQLRFGIEHRRERGGSAALTDTFARIGLTIPFDAARQSLTWNHDGADYTESVRWQVNRSNRRGGYSGTLGRSDGAFGSDMDAGFAYRHPRFGADLGAVETRTPDAPTRASQRVSVRTAVVVADGAFGMVDRVGDGYAVITTGDTAAGAVYVNPIADDYLASSVGPGPAVVGNLRPYEPRALALALPDLPADRETGDLFPVVAPGYKGGVRVRVGGERRLRLLLRVVDADGAALSLIGGQLTGPDGSQAVQVFVGRDGTLRAAGLTPGRWQLELDTQPPRRHAIDIADDPDGVVELGDLHP